MPLSSPLISPTPTVVGEPSLRALDLTSAYVGQVIEVPYELTLTGAHSSSWFSSFWHHSRVYTSSPFAEQLSLPGPVLPFSMIVFATTSMAHVDETINALDIGIDHAIYMRPAHPGDTLRQIFTIKHLRPAIRHDNSTIVTVACELVNQRGHLVCQADKVMLFPGVTSPNRLSQSPQVKPEQPRSHLLQHVLYHGEALPATANLAIIKPGQLMLHAATRPISLATNMQLSTLFKWAHPSIFNIKRFGESEVVVPAGLLLAAACSCSDKELFEFVYEQVDFACFANRASPVDLLGAISFVRSIRSLKEGFEEVQLTTLGFKNVDVSKELHQLALPVALFTQQWRPLQLEQFVAQFAPKLKSKIVVVVHRTLVRQSPYAAQRSIPLL